MNRVDGNTRLKGVSKAQPCPVCEGNHKCALGLDGAILCGRRSGFVPGFVCLGQCKGDPQWCIYRREGDPILESHHRTSSNNSHCEEKKKAIDWKAKAEVYARNLTPELRQELAEVLGLPQDCLGALRVGFNPIGPCWTFPEVDGSGRVVGITRRFRNGDKNAESGGSRGLFVPSGWDQRDGPIFSPEGPTDVLSATAMGFPAIGRPSNMAGTEHLAALLKNVASAKTIIVLGEWDAKENGTWPGRDGAVKIADELLQMLRRPVHWALPPKGFKDVRAWVNAQNPDVGCADAWGDLGEAFFASLRLQEAKGLGSTDGYKFRPIDSAIFSTSNWHPGGSSRDCSSRINRAYWVVPKRD